ncbi:caspase family protein [Streptosporangium sp. NPDC005286]|uniref:caspase, EACC1-associated type n=1 Tax=Streptosporangium sp. NPDC005286 TaxID=3154463 RepID=UPI0033B03C22
MTDALWDFSRSQAVLIGVGTYSHLPPVPAALNSLTRFSSLLTGPLCGWPSERISVISDVERLGDLPDQLVELFDSVKDVALFYFVGHGLFGSDDQLCLGLGHSRSDAVRRKTTSLPFDAIRYAINNSPALAKIVILDCCHAGLATGRPGTLSAAGVLEKTHGTGAYTLAAAEGHASAWYETDPAVPMPQTYFTKYLADVIESGIAGQGTYLTLDSIFAEVTDTLLRDGKPQPASKASAHAPRLIFARNAAHDQQPQHAGEPSSQIQPGHDAPHRTAAAHTVSMPDSRHVRTLSLAVSNWRDALSIFNGSPAFLGFSPDGSLLAGGRGSTVRLWRVDSGELAATLLTGHTGMVYSVAFSPDGTLLASGSGFDATVRLWRVNSSSLAATLSHITMVSSVAFSPDGTLLASSSAEGNVRLWRVDSGELAALLKGHVGMVNSVAFSPDGALLASTGSTVRLWRVDSGEPTAILTRHTGRFTSVAFSPDGALLASGGADMMVRLWRVDSGEPTATLTGHSHTVNSVAFSPDGALLASGGADKAVRLWRVDSGELAVTLTGHTRTVNSVAFSPDGALLASGGTDNTIRLWRAR